MQSHFGVHGPFKNGADEYMAAAAKKMKEAGIPIEKCDSYISTPPRQLFVKTRGCRELRLCRRDMPKASRKNQKSQIKVFLRIVLRVFSGSPVNIYHKGENNAKYIDAQGSVVTAPVSDQ